MRLIKWILTAMISTSALSVLAAPRVNNGGGGWLCRDLTTKSILWIKTVDLAELDYGNNGGAKFEPGKAWDIYQNKITEIYRNHPKLASLLKKHPVDLAKNFMLVPFTLPIVNDNNLIIRPTPQSCPSGQIEYIQIANYLVDGNLLIAKDIWNSSVFSELDKAALLVHEHLYQVLRDEYDEQGSSRVRGLVKALFSKWGLERIQSEVRFILLAGGGKDSQDFVAKFPVNLKCTAVVTENNTVKYIEIGQRVWQAPAYGSSFSVEIADFIFTVETSEADGTPALLQIEKRSQGLRTYLRSEDMQQAFLATRHVVLRLLSPGQPGLEAKLTCRTE